MHVCCLPHPFGPWPEKISDIFGATVIHAHSWMVRRTVAVEQNNVNYLCRYYNKDGIAKYSDRYIRTASRIIMVDMGSCRKWAR